MICIRTRYGKEVRVAAPEGETSGTLRWPDGEVEVPVIGGELVITPELAAQVPCPAEFLGETQCTLTSGTEQCMVIYIHKPQEVRKRWQSI